VIHLLVNLDIEVYSLRDSGKSSVSSHSGFFYQWADGLKKCQNSGSILEMLDMDNIARMSQVS